MKKRTSMQFLEEPYWLHKYIPVNRAPVPLLHYRLFFRGVYFFPSRISPEPFLRNTKKCLPIKWQMKPITYYIRWISDSVLSNFWSHANSRYRFFNCLPLPTIGYCMRLTDVVRGYMGTSINHVVKFLDIFDPPSPRPFVVTFTK